MRVAWVHPTWRDLVIERLAADATLRRRFLGRCGPHGIALALSTQGGVDGERARPLVVGDEDWDAIADRIYTLAPELEAREVVTVLTAVDNLLEAELRDALRAGEAAALARMALERLGELWESAHATLSLPCIEAWLSVAARLTPQPQPTFLAATWAELLPVALPDADDLLEMQRFTDWRTLCAVLRSLCPDLLSQLGYGAAQEDLVAAFRSRETVRGTGVARTGGPPSHDEPLDAPRGHVADSTVWRVLADL